jgi:Druantia protein DruA
MIECFELFSTGMAFALNRIAVRSDSNSAAIPPMDRSGTQPAERFRWTNVAVSATVRWAEVTAGTDRTSDPKSSAVPSLSGPMAMIECLTFSGRTFDASELELMRRIAKEFSALGVTEIARTVCELLEWKRPSGGLKNHECRQLLERLQDEGFLTLPELRKRGGKGPRRADISGACLEPAALEGTASECEPLDLALVEGEAESRRWREQVERYHYLGCRVPFGANLRYWVRHRDRELACLLWTSPAWKMQARDTWIGWSDEQRRRNLQSIVNNGRFLILPWVRVNGLASKILALSARQVPHDWESHYGYRPLLLETLVETFRFRGTCYRAANWIHVGQTAGRGRMDREHKAQGQAVKDIYVYPLVRDARQRLCSNPAPTHGHAPRAELVNAHSLFASLLWHQVRPRDRSASDARHRVGPPHGLRAVTVMVGAPDARSLSTREGTRPAVVMDAALPDPFPTSIETLFSQLVRRRLHSLAAREDS